MRSPERGLLDIRSHPARHSVVPTGKLEPRAGRQLAHSHTAGLVALDWNVLFEAVHSPLC